MTTTRRRRWNECLSSPLPIRSTLRHSRLRTTLPHRRTLRYGVCEAAERERSSGGHHGLRRLAQITDKNKAPTDTLCPAAAAAAAARARASHPQWMWRMLRTFARPLTFAPTSNRVAKWTTRTTAVWEDLGRDLQNILRQSYDYLTIMP